MASDRESSTEWQTETDGNDDDMDYEVRNMSSG